MEKERRYNRMTTKFEVFDDFVDGDIERTIFEKELAIVPEFQSNLDILIDNFIKFTQVYGFSKKVVLESLRDYIDEEGELNEL